MQKQIMNVADLQNKNDRQIVVALQKLGRLDDSFCEETLLSLLNHKNKNVRVLAIKNLAKMSDILLLPTFVRILQQDESAQVRRETMSAIGRLRSEKAIPVLIKYSNAKDPEIVMQALRGLLVFKNRELVQERVEQLKVHHNELVSEFAITATQKNNSTKKIEQRHDLFPNFMKNKIVEGNTYEILKIIPQESIHLTFTSPPYYNARDYSVYQSYKEYLLFLKSVFKEVHRVTKEGRFFILNTSPIIIPRISRNHSSKRYPIPYDIHPLLVEMGWEFIDDIVWVKPEASVKNRNAGFLQHRKPLGYKPNAITEMLMVYRKKTDRLIDWNIRQYSYGKVEKSKILGDYETSNIWHIDPCFDKVHSAVFPIELCERVVRKYSFMDDLVFDPFAGSGTLGRAAKKLKRNFFLTEKENTYINRMKKFFGDNNETFFSESNSAQFLDMETFKSFVGKK